MNKTTMTAMALASIGLAAFAESGVSKICKRYDELCTEWQANLENALGQIGTNAMPEILTVSLLRSRISRQTLLDNLAYPAQVIYFSRIWPNKFEPPIVNVGYLKIPENLYPVFMCLERMGFTYEEFTRAFTKYEITRINRNMFVEMGVHCGGNYFLSLDESQAATKMDTWFNYFYQADTNLPTVFPEIGDERKGSPYVSLNHVGALPNKNVLLEYDEMQNRLKELFSEKQIVISPDLTDAIAAIGHIRSLKAIPILTENLTVCPQVSTNAPGGYLFPAAEALIEIGPAIGYCFNQLEEAKPLSVEESLWLRISHELYPEGLEYDLMRRAETNDTRAVRLLDALPWRRLDSNYEIVGKPDKHMDSKHENE